MIFLGFPIDPLYKEQLEKVNPARRGFILEEGLEEISHEGLIYLGRTVGEKVTLCEISLLEAHIFSLLKKLVQNFPYDETALYLFIKQQ